MADHRTTSRPWPERSLAATWFGATQTGPDIDHTATQSRAGEMTATIIATERLPLRRFTLNDIEDIYEPGSDPDVIRFAQPQPFRDLEEARRRMRQAPFADYENYGYGRLAVVLKSSGKVIVFSGIKHLPQIGMDELGYRYKKRHWGK